MIVCIISKYFALHLADIFNLSCKDMPNYKLFGINFVCCVCLHKRWQEIGSRLQF